MANQQDDLLRRPLYVYGLPTEVLGTLEQYEATESSLRVEDEAPSTPSSNQAAAETEATTGSATCSLCKLSFASTLEQRSHAKSDLHYYNLKQKLRGQNPVSEQAFESLMERLDESLSGSDSSDSDDDDDDEDEDSADSTENALKTLLKKQARVGQKESSGDLVDEEDDINSAKALQRRNRGKSPLVWFRSSLLPTNHYFGLYRAILTAEEQRHASSELVKILGQKQIEPFNMPKPNKDGSYPEVVYRGPHIFMCMIGGGHFAAMVVSLTPRVGKVQATTMNREATVLAHKTFHRYTTRRKQGGSQGLNDNAKGAAQSVGASLRRQQEEALRKDIRLLLSEWKNLIDSSELVFIRATGSTNRATLFGPYEGQVLRQDDVRIRTFPFSTRRATQSELMRCFIELTRFKIREIHPVVEQKDTSTTPAKPSTSSSKPSKPKLTEEEEIALLHTSQIQAFIRRSKLPALLTYLKNNNVSPDFEFQPSEQNHHAPRPLHLAAAQSVAPLVLGLLTKGGANPLLLNNEGKTAFELAGDRSTRDAFRVARSELGEEEWTWDTAKVPAPLSKDDADRRDDMEKKNAQQEETARKKAAEEHLRNQADDNGGSGSGSAGKTRRANALVVGMAKTPQEQREEQTRGLTPEMRMKLERERRARAAEARLRNMKNNS